MKEVAHCPAYQVYVILDTLFLICSLQPFEPVLAWTFWHGMRRQPRSQHFNPKQSGQQQGCDVALSCQALCVNVGCWEA